MTSASIRTFLALGSLMVAAGVGCQSPPPAADIGAAPTGQQPAGAAPAAPGPAAAFPFAQYLRQRFGEAVPATEHWYIVVPAVGCKGCGASELRWLASRPPYGPQVTLVASGLLQKLTAAERARLARTLRVRADTLLAANNLLDRLRLPFPTVTGVVHVQPGQPPRYTAFDSETYQRVLGELPAR